MTAKVIMIPSEERSPILLDAFGRVHQSKYYGTPLESTAGKDSYQNLYLVVDENIKSGDFVCNTAKKLVFKADKELIDRMVNNKHLFKYILKVIASTEHLQSKTPSEEFKNVSHANVVPTIPESFIQNYIVSRLLQIEEVNVEMNQPVCECDTTEKELKCFHKVGIHDCTKPYDGDDFYGHKIKTTEDNEVIIHLKK